MNERRVGPLSCETTTPDPVTGRTVVTNLRLPGQYDERLLGSLGLQGPYYNWNRWYLPSVGRYLELDPIAKAGGFNGFYGPNWYGYAEGDPLNYSDPFGLLVTCTYTQEGHRMTCKDKETAQFLFDVEGYSGMGIHKNKPASQCIQDWGPIPTGAWSIGPGYQSTLGNPSFDLAKKPGTNTCGRGPPGSSKFMIHADSIDNPGFASQGCIIIPLAQRQIIKQHGGGDLEVLP